MGGAGSTSTATGGAGGGATASSTATGNAAATTATLTSQATATGGAGGTSLTNLAAGGAATATSVATGAGGLASTAIAAGGAGLGGAGIGTATGNATGATSTVEALASSALPAGAHVVSITAETIGNVNATSGGTLNTGTSKMFADALIGFLAPSPTGMQGTAWLVGSPLASDISTVPSAIKTAIGSNTILGLGDVAGGYSTAGSGTETVANTLDLNPSSRIRPPEEPFSTGRLPVSI